MIALVLDTHAVVWLMLGSPRLSVAARQAIEAASKSGAQIGVPTISFVEIAYLEEKGSLSKGTLAGLFAFLDDTTTGLVEIPLTRATAAALQLISRADIPDMPDRIVAATAVCVDAPLVTSDSKIQASQIETIW
jgi:PIN domain nuclease of toxin-antitoxin system